MRKSKSPSKYDARILEAAEQIFSTPTPEQEKAFLTRQLVQVTLPHSNPGDVQGWYRRNGDLVLTIKPSLELDKKTGVLISTGIPYGTIPRLLLFWITTEALRTQSRRLELGNSLSAFMRDLGLTPTGGGKRSDAKRLREQMRRLFRSTISLDYQKEDAEKWLDMQVAPEGELWWNNKEPNNLSIWQSWIELGDKFYQAIISSPVPLDMRALRALKKSPLALDLYAWATWRSYSASQHQKPKFVPWRGLMQQLGTDYASIRDFRKKVKITMKRVQAVYPGLRIEETEGGLSVLPMSRTAVSTTPKTIHNNL